MKGRRLGTSLLVVLAVMAVGLGASAGVPFDPSQLSDDFFDEGKGDGTHDTQSNPSSSFWSSMIGFSGFDRPSGTPQEVATGYTVDGGETWFDNGNIAGGSNLLQGNPSTAWDPKREVYAIATENTFTGSGQRPIAYTYSDSWGASWAALVDTYTSIGFGFVAVFPSLIINENESSSNYGQHHLAWTLTNPTLTTRDLFYQRSQTGASWSNPVKINGTDCPVVGRGEIVLAGEDLYAAYSCEETDSYDPVISISTDNGASWTKASIGLPTDLAYSGEAATCNSGSPFDRTVYGDIGVSDFPRLKYAETGDMLFTTFTTRGAKGDLSDIHVFGAPASGTPSWAPYGDLPGDAGATYFAPEVGVNTVDGARQLWYTGMMVDPSGQDYTVNTFVTQDLATWNKHAFNPTYQLPVLKPNEDTALSDCYLGYRFFDLDPLGTKMGLTYVGTPSGSSPRATGPADADPDILFIALDAPAGVTDTTLTLKIKKTDAKVKASGTITPAVPGEQVKVTFLKRNNGIYKVVDTKNPTFADTGEYRTSFKRLKRGSCRVMAEWGGNTDFGPSEASKTFSCKR